MVALFLVRLVNYYALNVSDTSKGTTARTTKDSLNNINRGRWNCQCKIQLFKKTKLTEDGNEKH